MPTQPSGASWPTGKSCRGEALRLADAGCSPQAIRRRLLGREGFLTAWSGGNFSKENLIRALLAMGAGEKAVA